MPNPRSLALALAAVLASSAACDTYNPPPEVELLAPAKGQWFPETTLELKFTEAIDPATLRFAIWPILLDKEGVLMPDAQPVVDDCVLGEPCGDLTLSLSEDGTLLTIEQGETFKGKLAKPYFIEIAAGLSDTVGRIRRVPTRLVFQIDPPPGSGPVNIELNSGVLSIAADLGDILAGVFLRMFADMGINQETGEVWLMATVAGKNADAIPNTVDPTEMSPKLGTEGWTLLLKGSVTPLEEEGAEGAFFLETIPQDVDVKVLGIIRVRLNQLRLRATLRLGASPDGRDTFEGVLSASKVLLGDDGDDLGAVAAADWLGFGIFQEELDSDPRFAGFPTLCQAEPCKTLIAGGGDCQLPDPWIPGPSCP